MFSNYIIKPISNGLALQMVVTHHRLHTKCPCSKAFGLFEIDTDKCVGVITYGVPHSPTLRRGICGPEEQDNVYELNRVWVDPSVPDGGAAYLIANTIRKVDRQIIVSYVDTAYREEVTPLQLAGFYYTGVTGKHTDPVVTGRTGHHASLLQGATKAEFPQAYYVANHFLLKVNKPYMEEYIQNTYITPLVRIEDPRVDLDYILEADLTQSPSATIKAPALRRVYAYLCNTRCIDRDLVSHFLKKRYLAMDANFNLCFLTYRDGKVISITKKGTDQRHPFKQNIVREKHTGFWYGSSTVEEFREVYVFESCVDLLSFLTLAKRGQVPKPAIDACYVSLNGASTFYLERVLSEHPTIQRVHLCLDNDEVGRRTSANFMRCHTEREVDTMVEQLNNHRFPGDMFKDWNERLQNDHGLPF